MSLLTVQLGQCGNQIGCHFFSTLASECLAAANKNHNVLFNEFDQVSSEMFFETSEEGKSNGSLRYTARSVLVDSEEKVIAQVTNCAESSGTWSYDLNSQMSYKRGSGNNWAHGYCDYGPQIYVNFKDIVRKKIEKCDRFTGFLTIMSLAGGTGSGAGSYLTDFLQDHYPNSLLVNQVVWPYASGEVAVQNYNALLSMAHIYQSADSIMTFDNDYLYKICTNYLDVPKISFHDVNDVISKKLAFFLLPSSPSFFSHSKLSESLGDLLQALTPHPDYKIISMIIAPLLSKKVLNFTSYYWPAILKSLKHVGFKSNPNKYDLEWQLKFDSELKQGKSFADMLILRGSSLNELSENDIKQYLKMNRDYPVFHSDGFSLRTHSKSFSKMDKSAVLISNDCSQMNQLNCIVDKAWKMFTCKAYLHQYKKYGLEEDDIVDCFVTLEQVLASYAKL